VGARGTAASGRETREREVSEAKRSASQAGSTGRAAVSVYFLTLVLQGVCVCEVVDKAERGVPLTRSTVFG